MQLFLPYGRSYVLGTISAKNGTKPPFGYFGQRISEWAWNNAKGKKAEKRIGLALVVFLCLTEEYKNTINSMKIL